MPPKIKIISAGAGSGKTYRLTMELTEAIRNGVRPDGIIATTFTNKAAAELKERVSVKLLEEGMTEEALAFSGALVGTVHSIGVQLLKRFAFDAGVSPTPDIIPDNEHRQIFNRSLAMVLTPEEIRRMDALKVKFGYLSDYDWRGIVKEIAGQVEVNNFSEEDIAHSKTHSVETLLSLFDTPAPSGRELDEALIHAARRAANSIKNNAADTTRKTANALGNLMKIIRDYEQTEAFTWPQWAALYSLDVGKKSRDYVQPLRDAAEAMLRHPDLQNDIREFIERVFDLAVRARKAYAAYKRRHGLIDYNDMEVHIRRLLGLAHVRQIIADEIDLLLVDEFQDTSPLQLDIFWTLAQLVRSSVWVGDPKQAIYSFRGAEPELMEALIRHLGGVRKENILPYSWRSREDLVHFTNVIFTRAFSDMAPERIALEAKRIKAEEPAGVGPALKQWHFVPDGSVRLSVGILTTAFAHSLKQWLDTAPMFVPKGAAQPRVVRPGDVAILMRTNKNVQEMAAALEAAGFQVAVEGVGLLKTAEVGLVMACIRYLLNPADSIAAAEIMKYGAGTPLEAIVQDRHRYLKGERLRPWGADKDLHRRLLEQRDGIRDLTIKEVLDMVLEELQIRRIVRHWAGAHRRLDNIEVLRGLAVEFEDLCKRTHKPATPAGFLLWLQQLADNEEDKKSGGVHADAVNVLTYHKSKGLEWPVVLLGELWNRLRVDLFKVSVVRLSPDFDPENILSGRLVRYWPNPFGKKVYHTPFGERLEASVFYQEAEAQARAEEKRLLYVGMTRARDYQIVPTADRKKDWLDRVADGEILTGEPPEPFDWRGHEVVPDFQSFSVPSALKSTPDTAETVVIPAPKEHPPALRSYFWDVNKVLAEPLRPYLPAKEWTFADPLQAEDPDERRDLARATMAIVHAYRPGDAAHNQRIVRTILHHFRLDGRADEVAHYVDGLFAQAGALMDLGAAERMVLLEGSYDGRFASLQLDFVVWGADGVQVLHQHMPGALNPNVKAAAREMAHFFGWIPALLKEGMRFEWGLLHLCPMGKMVQLIIKN